MITMSVAILALLGWLVLLVFALVPKGLSVREMFFLYFLIGILSITVFSILDLNLQWVPLTRSVEGAFAMYICRFIVIPFSILLSVSVLIAHREGKWRWLFTAIIILFLCLADRIYLWADLITYVKWNEFYSALMYAIDIVVIWLIAKWFLRLDKGEGQRT
jgi:hypothetical protein